MSSPDFAILVALNEEKDEVLKVFNSEAVPRNRYHRPAWELAPNKEISGVLYHINDQGLMSAQSATTDLLRKVGQDLDLVVNIGIGGVIADDDLEIGDVVCASRACEIDYNEEYKNVSEKGESDQSQRLPGPKVFDSENTFKWDVKYLEGKPSELTQWRSVCKNTLEEFDFDKDDIDVTDPSPSIEVGPVASSGAVIKDKSTEDGFADYITSRVDRNILSADQESAGVLRAIKEWNARHGDSILSGVLRGMSDFADENKAELEEGRQSYAANTAASFFNFLLENGWIERVFRDDVSFSLPNPRTPEEVDTVNSVVSQLRGQIEAQFDVRHMSMNRSMKDIGIVKTSTIPIKRMLSENSALEHLLEELVTFEYKTQITQPRFKSNYAAEIFSKSINQNMNMLNILNKMRTSTICGESIQNASQNLYNMRLRYDVHTATTVCDEFGGTTLDSFITRSWEKKVVENHPWQPIGAAPETINEQEATFNIVLERFDSYDGELEYDINVKSVNDNVSINGDLISGCRETLKKDGCTHIRFTIDSSSKFKTMRFDSEAFPWHVADILKLTVTAETASGTKLDEIGYAGEDQVVAHIPLPGADKDSGDILVPSITV